MVISCLLYTSKAVLLEERYSGRTTAQKLDELRADMREEGAEALLISTLDDLAWLFNLRGDDVLYLSLIHICCRAGRGSASAGERPL